MPMKVSERRNLRNVGGSGEPAEGSVVAAGMSSAEGVAWERLILLGVLPADELYSPGKAKEGEYSRRLKEWSKAHPDLQEPASKAKPAALTFEQKWAVLEDHSSEIHGKGWPQMKAIAALASRASELEIHRLTQRNLEQLLEGAQRRARPAAKPVEAGCSFTVTATHWAVDGVFRHGLNLLVGQAGAGKSRLAAAAMAAWLRGDETWLNRAMPCSLPMEQRHALIVGSDQPLEDWALTLEPVGLAQRITPTEVQLHRRVTLHPLESQTILDSDGLAMIRRWVDAHPGGMVLIDSLAACLPPGVDEDKASAARPVHQLQEAIAGGWGILTHHARKGAGKEGNIGVGAGRGSSAIDGAVSRVVGLSLIYRMQNGVMVPQEADPRRELMSTKRGGATLNLIVRSDASGYWSNEGDAAELKRQERHEQAISSLSESHCGVLATLEDAAGELTTRQVAEAMGEAFDSSGAGAVKLRRALKRLETLGLIEARKVGVDRVFRAHPNTPNTLDVDRECSDCSDQSYQGISDVRIGVRICSEGPSEHSEQASEQSEQSEHSELFGQASEQASEHPEPVVVTGPNTPNTPIDVLSEQTGQWEPGWQQIGTGSGSGSVLCIDPRGKSRQVKRKLIRPGLPSRQGSAA